MWERDKEEVGGLGEGSFFVFGKKWRRRRRTKF
jgi:hypothetical protein